MLLWWLLLSWFLLNCVAVIDYAVLSVLSISVVIVLIDNLSIWKCCGALVLFGSVLVAAVQGWISKTVLCSAPSSYAMCPTFTRKKQSVKWLHAQLLSFMKSPPGCCCGWSTITVNLLTQLIANFHLHLFWEMPIWLAMNLVEPVQRLTLESRCFSASYKLRRLGVLNQIVYDSNSHSSAFGQQNLSDSKSDFNIVSYCTNIN